ncbi:MAG: Dam family site-specific DNA-(adenine-N6)-methyltransferase [Leptospirales bacterium]|jgi:DNA adenine methylase
MTALPKQASNKTLVPPLKCQGIKTKLVPFIAASIRWDGGGRWVEPFLGSGSVLFNIAPERAIVSDSNPHIIRLYSGIQDGSITEQIVRQYLDEAGLALSERGAEYFYEVREAFNVDEDPLKFLFLNRSCFNGMMRFNARGQFNVPFGHKPERFRRAYVTKVVNQVAAVRALIARKDWEFRTQDWRRTVAGARRDDFLYLDPPYIGRHVGYYNGWSAADAVDLARRVQDAGCGFALSMWKENRYRSNEHLAECWSGAHIATMNHFYYLGARKALRNAMTEALAIHPDCVAGADQAPPDAV